MLGTWGIVPDRTWTENVIFVTVKTALTGNRPEKFGKINGTAHFTIGRNKNKITTAPHIKFACRFCAPEVK
jgi:hypothetical protein